MRCGGAAAGSVLNWTRPPAHPARRIVANGLGSRRTCCGRSAISHGRPGWLPPVSAPLSPERSIWGLYTIVKEIISNSNQIQEQRQLLGFWSFELDWLLGVGCSIARAS